LGHIIFVIVIYLWYRALTRKKRKQEEKWGVYLSGLSEAQCFSVAKDKSMTKFTDKQRDKAYRRGCELRRIKELGE